MSVHILTTEQENVLCGIGLELGQADEWVHIDLAEHATCSACLAELGDVTTPTGSTPGDDDTDYCPVCDRDTVYNGEVCSVCGRVWGEDENVNTPPGGVTTFRRPVTLDQLDHTRWETVDYMCTMCKHCHLFVVATGNNQPGLSEWDHCHRGDDADEALDESHEAAPGDVSAPLSWWKVNGPPAMLARFTDTGEV